MKKFLVCLVVSMSACSALADDLLPQDVQKFIERREGCDHMRGEIPDSGDRQRMAEVNREIRKLCRGTDEALVKLKKKYAANALVMQRLREFEDDIEASAR